MVMLQPRKMIGVVLLLCIVTASTGFENIESTRVRRQNDGDVTTVLLVDSHGRSSLGRFLSVRPAVGLLTSTARTFIQEGVTTEYATQVLGTTLDNGRLYAHLLTKSSRVLYDNDLPTKTHHNFHDNWKNNIVKNVDYISPNKADAFLVFPTQKLSNQYKFVERHEEDFPKLRAEQPTTNPENIRDVQQASEEEILNSASSNNARVPYQEPFFRQKQSVSTSSSSSSSSTGNNVKIFKVNPAERHINLENFASKEQSTENDIASNVQQKELKYEILSPSKIKPKMNIPTFTVRNDFSPSGYSFLGDLPEFEYDTHTEKAKPTTPAERRAKLLFRGGQPVKQELKDLETVTYMGFADFTTTVGDTVIIFTPHTTSSSQNFPGQVTSISGEATIRPTKTFEEPTVTSTIKTFLSHDPAMKTETVTGHKFTMKTVLPTMVINASNRHREPKKDESEEEKEENLNSKLAVLAHEQDANKYDTEQNTDKYEPVLEEVEPSLVETTEEIPETITPEIVEEPELTTVFTPEVIQPSETSSAPMLSTPSDEDIAKIFASLAALAAQNSVGSSTQATEPLQIVSTSSIDESPVVPTQETETESETKVLGGATTIFFEDDFNPFTTFDTFTPSQVEEKPTTPELPATLEQEVTTENLPTTDQQQETTFNLPATTEKVTEKELPSTEREPTTLNEIIPTSEESISTASLDGTTPMNEEKTNTEKSNNDVEISCVDGGRIVPTTVYKTLTYLTTFYIPVETTQTTSVKSNIVVSTDIGFETQVCTEDTIASTSVQETTSVPTITTEKLTTKNEETTVQNIPEIASTTEQLTTVESNQGTTPMETTPFEITTESKHITEFDSEPLETTTDSGEEIELIFKTLYTTYTYLTTFFQESTSSVASRKVVVTNVITSTLDPDSTASDPAVAGLFAREDSLVHGTEYRSKPASFEDFADIAASQTNVVQPTILATILESDIEKEENESNLGATPALSDENVIQTSNAVKTYYTTYTYFTTIFVDGETEISSRTEVYTNFVTPSLDSSDLIVPTAALGVDSINELPKNQAERPQTSEEDTSRQLQLKVTPINSYSSTINRQRTSTVQDNESSTDFYEKDADNIDNNIFITSKTDLEPSHSYTTLQRTKSINSEATQVLENKIFNINDYETISTMVTDVRSSSSSGERRFIDNVDKRNVLDDQVVAESNNDSEISPSPTLLLQTSFTTFTYFTTMYFGTTSSNVVSRLETITNVVTETLTPTQTLAVEDQSLPITYFTTFTYWTTLYKDGSTTITSREETISNLVTPSVSATEEVPVITQTIEPTATIREQEIAPTGVVSDDDEFTTFYTTYTYFTTSYLGNSTVLNSRLETVTNVLNNTGVTTPSIEATTSQSSVVENEQTTSTTPVLFPTGLLSTMVETIVENDLTTLFSTDVYGTYIDGLYAKVLESTTKVLTDKIEPSNVEPLLPTGTLSLNHGKIVDAEEVSTLFFRTEAIGTYIDKLYTKVTQSTSSLTVNEERKAALPTDLDPVALAHRTGLVRLIEGSIIENKTTTIYQSKVLGTVIDGRYAQIIESTSSFIVEKTPAPSATQIEPTATIGPDGKITPTATVITPSPVVIESSLNEDTNKPDEENTTEEDEGYDEDDEDNNGNSRVKSRLTFQTKKRTFTPAIRPFASRNRPTFNPKRKGATANGPTTITRTDFTPTITATPALKGDSTRGRFNGNRRQSTNAVAVSATPSGSRRFARPKATSTGVVSSSGFGGGRRSSSGRIQPTASGSRRGGAGFRTSSAILPGRASSNLFASRGRIRPTLSSSLLRGQASVTTPSTDSTDGGNDLTTVVTDEPTDFTDDDSDTTLPISTTTESALTRRRNPLLRFNRPPLSRPNAGATTPRPPTTPKKSGNLRKTTTTTPKPKGRSTFARPLPPVQNRPRPGGNGLFPRRDLFKPRTPPPEEPKAEEEDDLDDDDLDLEDEEDTEYEGSDTNTQTEKAPAAQNRKSRAYNPSQILIKPFAVRRRSKRQINYSRFRRPNAGKSTTSAPTTEEPTEAPKPATRSSKNARFRPRPGSTTTSAPTSPPKRISPSRASTNQGRSQFTLREKDSSSNTRSNFKRPNSSPSRARTTSKPQTLSRPKAPRLRTTTSKSSEESSYRNANNRQKTTTSRSRGRGRPTTQRGNVEVNQRNGYNNDINDNFVLPTFDGTITITHQIPTEATIPVVNGKITEYKNIITAKLSTEVLNPQQYITRINTDGKEVKVLTSESTNVGINGATEITQFVLNETPTTSVVFTPTYIRGRRTSFSHVIPSTVYGVEQVVSTIQPQLAAQAPLANILLSQLLLGNLGIPQQNPLLALQNQGSVAPPTPTTEYKTRTTTYVTTVTDATSTVIPLTFRGKEILTTIVDSSTSVITATEFITDTVVVTPTAALPNNNQLNSLLLPLLLQQQQQQQQSAANPLLPPTGIQTTGLLPLEQPLLQDNVANDLLLQNSQSKEIDEEPPAENPSPRKKVARKRSRVQKPPEPTPPKETSVITLYVSGKRPGEFSTVLSTVVVGENRKKREIQVEPSKVLPIIGTTLNSMLDIMPAMGDVHIESSQTETESLESIIGDVNKHIHTSNNLVDSGTKYVKSSVVTSGNFLS